MHILVICRIPRCISTLTYFKSMRDILSVIRTVLPFCAGLGSVLFIIFLVFSIIGNHLWGGLLHSNTVFPPEVPELYYYNNFNDIASGMVTLFELLIVNNW